MNKKSVVMVIVGVLALAGLIFVIAKNAPSPEDRDDEIPPPAAESNDLSDEEQQSIFKVLDIKTASDGTLRGAECENDPMDVEMQPLDLNNDGQTEVFVTWGNTCTSGATGSSLSLMIKNPSGEWVDQFGFPAATFQLLEEVHDGYPDILVGGRGFCQPIYTWRGSKYELDRRQPENPGDCDEVNSEPPLED
ncbi:MAG: hypothetical protein AB7F86_14940 [Bdellovibrionales bacterium]